MEGEEDQREGYKGVDGWVKVWMRDDVQVEQQIHECDGLSHTLFFYKFIQQLQLLCSLILETHTHKKNQIKKLIMLLKRAPSLTAAALKL